MINATSTITDCYSKLVEHFGDRILSSGDQSVDRKVLGSIVFSDKNEKQVLESIVWPEIRRLIRVRIDQASPSAKLLVVEAAILIEANWNDLFTKIIVVTGVYDTIRLDRSRLPLSLLLTFFTVFSRI